SLAHSCPHKDAAAVVGAALRYEIRVAAEQRVGTATVSRTQAFRLRDRLGPLPFRPVTLEQAWLAPPVPELARAAYEERELPSGHLNNERLAVLADALEENSCDNQELLAHLRQQETVHVRGSWSLDLVLGKS